MENRYISRAEAADYLTNQLGLKTAKTTLQKLATVGGGPTYRRFGRNAVYLIEELDQWASEKLTAPRRSSSCR